MGARLNHLDLTFVDPPALTQVVALLRELITAKTIHSKYMDSKVAHSTAQRFNTEVSHTVARQGAHLPNQCCCGRTLEPGHIYVQSWNFGLHTNRSK